MLREGVRPPEPAAGAEKRLEGESLDLEVANDAHDE
jgi:hypothetical protein